MDIAMNFTRVRGGKILVLFSRIFLCSLQYYLIGNDVFKVLQYVYLMIIFPSFFHT